MSNSNVPDRSKCPPEYQVFVLEYSSERIDDGPDRWICTPSRAYTERGESGAIEIAWDHRDRIVADTIARVVAALRVDAAYRDENCDDEDGCAALEEFAAELERGEVEL